MRACRRRSRSLAILFIPLLAIPACRSTPEPTLSAEFVAENNRAVGLMGQFDFNGAVAAFESLHARSPQWPGFRLNLAVALMNRQQTADPARAEALLRDLLTVPGVERRARYTLGLLLLHQGREAEALPLLSTVARGDPPDGFAAYFTGQLRLNEAPAEALEWYRQAARQQPLLRSAHYGAFLALRRLDRDDEAEAALARFQELERHPQATVAEFKYTRMGPLAETITVDATIDRRPSVPAGARFRPAAAIGRDAGARWRRAGPPRSVTVTDIDGDDQPDLFIAAALEGHPPNAVLLARDDGYLLDRSHMLAGIADVRAAIWGDLDDDGLVDVVLCGAADRTRIVRQVVRGQWADVTAASSVKLSSLDAVDGTIFDADHDGDLDVWLVNAAGPNELLNNDGGGRFRAIGTSAGVGGDGRPSRGIAVADLDGDRDSDVIVIKATPPHDVFLNERGWQYRRDTHAKALAAAPIAALVAGDFDADGQPELYTAGERGIERWRRGATGDWQSEVVASRDGPTPPDRLAIIDTNGDGALELAAAAGDGWRIYEPASDGTRWTTPTVVDGGTDAALGWAVAHDDPTRGPSIVGIRADGAPVTWKPGPGRHGYLSVSFTGRDPTSDQRRSNVSGVGTRAALRVGSHWTAFETTGVESGPGRSLQPFTIGLGGHAAADFVAITWSDGVFQTELALKAGQLHRIPERQRQLSSCPVLFAWDGVRFAFVTDVLGVGGIGFLERPGVYAPAHPRENVLLPAHAPIATGGVYRLKIAEPMEEVTYLDQAALVAYDLPPGWEMALDERKAITGPAPTGGPLFYRRQRHVVRARRTNGDDVTDAVVTADRRAVGPAEIDSRFIGLARRFVVTLGFDRPIDAGPGQPVLLVDGWVEYPYAQTVFAAWQADVAYEAPTLEARGGDGRWRVVAREFGYPAGMPRQMAFPLSDLPKGTTELRLTTAQEIYWDRIAVVHAEPAPAVRRHVMRLRQATLDTGGFARRTTGPQRTPHYDDEARVPLADTRHPRGWYTAFGDVDPLVADEDSAVAIFGPGEEIVLGFEAPAVPLPDGWSRRLVLELRGWCKDMDLYTLDGETIEPLPGVETAARARLHPQFNTRYAAGY